MFLTFTRISQKAIGTKNFFRKSSKMHCKETDFWRQKLQDQTKGISPRETVEVFTNAEKFQNEAVIRKLANVSGINFGDKTDKPSFTFLVGSTEVSIPLSENLDLAEEKKENRRRN